MEPWVGRIEYTAYGALDRPYRGHWIGHIWSIGYTTYEALGRLHMEYWVGHIWSTG